MPRPSRRAHIVGVALELFAQRGYEATSLQDIATAAETTKASLYYYFPTKRGILDAIIEPVVQHFDDLLQEFEARSKPPDTREILNGYLEGIVADYDLARYLFADRVMATEPDLIKLFAAQRSRFVALLTGGKRSDTAVTLAECSIGLLQESTRRIDLTRPALRTVVVGAATRAMNA
jgi:AcrR family transcriptional regulator